jgi:hypothetical protein
MSDQNTVSYAADVRPLFTDTDVSHMSFMFDLSSYDDTKNNADDIYSAVSNGSMPPAPEGPWAQEKVATFKAWMDGGFQP